MEHEWNELSTNAVNHMSHHSFNKLDPDCNYCNHWMRNASMSEQEGKLARACQEQAMKEMKLEAFTKYLKNYQIEDRKAN